jgi:hypothetical protein
MEREPDLGKNQGGKEEGQPFSQDGWPFVYGYRSCAGLKESGSAVLCVLWQKPETCWRLNEPRLNLDGATGGAPSLPRR